VREITKRKMRENDLRKEREQDKEPRMNNEESRMKKRTDNKKGKIEKR
jgi:hypothetical protein